MACIAPPLGGVTATHCSGWSLACLAVPGGFSALVSLECPVSHIVTSAEEGPAGVAFPSPAEWGHRSVCSCVYGKRSVVMMSMGRKPAYLKEAVPFLLCSLTL